jgi:hypothetical protein
MLLVCVVCALLFAFAMATHCALGVLLIHVSGGLALLFPLSWETWALQLVRLDNWLGTTIPVAAALFVYAVLKVGSYSRLGHAERTHEETSLTSSSAHLRDCFLI